MKYPVPLLLTVLLLAGGCAIPEVRSSEPVSMVPARLNVTLPDGTSLYIDNVRLESAAGAGKAPYDELVGRIPLIQPQGLTNYRESIRLTLSSINAKLSGTPEASSYVLRTSILGGMTIPFREAYAILFVHYQLEDSKTGKIVWIKNVYSQARLENPGTPEHNLKMLEAAYTRLATANLRQMATALANWFVSGQNDITNRS